MEKKMEKKVVECEMLDCWEAVMGEFTIYTDDKEEAYDALARGGWILIRADGGKTSSGIPYLHCLAKKA